MLDRLISLITPCYNTGAYIHRLLESVLNQTYPRVEMIIVDDGSTDNTFEIIKHYQTRFADRGYQLYYFYQENAGQSAALNFGLKKIRGDYLAWPDSDDFYADNDSLEMMVDALEKAAENFAMVRTKARIVDEYSLAEIRSLGENTHYEEDYTLFEDCMFCRNDFYFLAGGYMVKTDVLKQETDLDIYVQKDAGQNWQLFLPILYSYQCITIQQIKYNVVQRHGSHSRGQYCDYHASNIKLTSFETVLYETLKRISKMSNEEREKYNIKIRIHYLRERLQLSYKFRKRKDYISYYKQWCNIDERSKLLGNRLEFISVITRTELWYEYIKNIIKK